MGFCTEEEAEDFLKIAPTFEQMLAHDGIRLCKYYLDITREEQRRRLNDRKKDPLKQWKVSDIDEAAQKHWKDYSRARNLMLARTHTEFAPWAIVRADEKRAARLAVLRHFVSQLDYRGKKEKLLRSDPDVIFPYAEENLRNGMIAP